MKVKSESEVVQSCLTLSDPMDCSLPGSSTLGIFQELVASVFSTDYYKEGTGHASDLNYIFLEKEKIKNNHQLC